MAYFTGAQSVLAEQVDYRDEPPWPTEPDGAGAVLRRIDTTLFGNDPAHWISQDPASVDSDGDGLPDWWESLYTAAGLDPAASNNPYADFDGDGMFDRDEFTADTIPVDAASYLGFQTIEWTGSGADISWIGGREAIQYLERTLSLSSSSNSWTCLLYTSPSPRD